MDDGYILFNTNWRHIFSISRICTNCLRKRDMKWTLESFSKSAVISYSLLSHSQSKFGLVNCILNSRLPIGVQHLFKNERTDEYLPCFSPDSFMIFNCFRV